LTWPAMHNLVGQWIPPNERSSFVSAYFGGSFGALIAFPLFGLIVKVSSWEWIFHACGISGVIWYMLWLYYVYDTPDKHPRIHYKEREFILRSLGSSVQNNGEKPDIPWKSILFSKPVWINSIGHFGALYGILTLFQQGPTYFKSIHEFGVEATGLLTGLPHLLIVAFSIISSKLADYALSQGKITRNNLRRSSAFVAIVMNGCAVLGLAYSGCSRTFAVLFFSFALCFNGANSSSVLSSIVDIAPNFAGITMGIMSTVASVGPFVSPIIVGFITFQHQTAQAWQYVFQICSAILIASGVIYICFIDTAVQRWNNVPENSSTDEVRPLYTNGAAGQNTCPN